MFFFDDDCCCSGVEDESCCCGGTDTEGCNCDDEGCDCGHDHDHDAATIVMTDTETGEEYTFTIVDDFPFENEHFCVLITVDDEEPEMVITKVVTMDDGTEGLMSLDEEEYNKVYAEYERLCEEEDYEIEDEEE